ncbi:MAG: hypothetical protein NTV34_16595, partial [Proteobacteria bacterium]|nr:hypothetical protein [Pseudomonadota bacterium]
WLHKLNPDRLYSLAYSPYHPNSEKQYYFSFFVGRSAKDELFVTPLGISDSPTSTQSQVRSQEQETRKVDKFDLELGRLSASTENKRDFCKTWVHDSRRNNMDRATIDKTYHTQIKLCADGQSVQLFDDFYKYTSEGNEKYFTGKAKSTIVDINALSLPFESKRYLDANKL